MRLEKIFENVDTTNIDMDAIDKLNRESPRLTKEMIKIEKAYDSFYKKNRKKILKLILKTDIEYIPLLDFFKTFAKK